MIEQLLLLVIVITILLCLLYSLLIGSYCYGWIKIKSSDTKKINTPVFVSVIVAARNEEQTIINCLTSIANQNYPVQQFELIIVDDASTDATNKLIRQFCEEHKNVQLITLTDEQGGKKNAIRRAIEFAKGELIVTTDADCVMGVNWLSTIVAHFRQTNAKMIVAPVSFYDEKIIFEKMQSLEFMAIIGSSGGSLYFNKAIMCNGANLAYTKEIFYEVNGFTDIDKGASGDDVLLMYKIKKKYPKGIHFLKHTDAVVFTKAKLGVKEFLDQRKRWASKGFKALNKETKYVSLVVYFFNLSLLFAITLFFCLPNTTFRLTFFKISLIIVGIKAFIDFLLLFLTASFFKKKQLLIYFLPEQFFYILYVVLIGLVAVTTKKYKWKNRNTN